MVRERFGVDPDTCTGDHSCIRLSGCPSLTVKENPDPLRSDPVAHVDNTCVGCGVCGEVADAAALCPSFYRAELIDNPSGWDRFLHAARAAVIGAAAAAQRPQAPALQPLGCAVDDRANHQADDRGARRPGRRRADRLAHCALPRPTATSCSRPPCPAWRSAPAPRIYYLEFFPRAGPTARAASPSWRSCPSPGMSTAWSPRSSPKRAGRLSAGWSAAERTTLISSTHRAYAIGEKSALGQGATDRAAAAASWCALRANARLSSTWRQTAQSASQCHQRRAARRDQRREACCPFRKSRFAEAIRRAGSPWRPISPRSRMRTGKPRAAGTAARRRKPQPRRQLPPGARRRRARRRCSRCSIACARLPASGAAAGHWKECAAPSIIRIRAYAAAVPRAPRAHRGAR